MSLESCQQQYLWRYPGQVSRAALSVCASGITSLAAKLTPDTEQNNTLLRAAGTPVLHVLQVLWSAAIASIFAMNLYGALTQGDVEKRWPAPPSPGILTWPARMFLQDATRLSTLVEGWSQDTRAFGVFVVLLVVSTFGITIDNIRALASMQFADAPWAFGASAMFALSCVIRYIRDLRYPTGSDFLSDPVGAAQQYAQSVLWTNSTVHYLQIAAVALLALLVWVPLGGAGILSFLWVVGLFSGHSFQDMPAPARKAHGLLIVALGLHLLYVSGRDIHHSTVLGLIAILLTCVVCSGTYLFLNS